MEHFVVIGAGQAGQSLTAKLRTLGFDGKITLIGEESAPPYQRPPLSKSYLLGEMELERLYLRPLEFYRDQKIDLMLGRHVSAIDPKARQIQVNGERLAYDKLALTTGSTPRRLPDAIGGNLGGVFTVRNLADVDAMAARFDPGNRVLIIGGGYIGLEAAAVTAKKGLQVTLIEMADRILQRVAGAETSDFIRALHKSHKADIRESVGLSKLLGNDGGHVIGAELTDGSVIEADFVIVGVGITPNDALAHAAGLQIDNGIAVNEFGQTSDAQIYAAGDCASFPYQGGRIRLESVGNAIDQAENAAANMLGQSVPYQAKPWFWSDQYDMKLQIAGLNTGYDQIVARQGDTPGAMSFWYFKGARLLAVDAMNDPRAYMVGKRLIEGGKSPKATLIGDPATDLKSLLRA